MDSKLRKRIIKNILSALAVAVFGFILLNATFIFDWLFQSAVRRLIELFTPVDFNMAFNWYPPMMHGTFLVIIGIISRLIFKSKLGTLYKATCMIVPLAVVFVTIGMFLYPNPLAAYSISVLFGIGVLYFLYSTKQPWLYYYSLILISLTMLIIAITGTEI